MDPCGAPYQKHTVTIIILIKIHEPTKSNKSTTYVFARTRPALQLVGVVLAISSNLIQM